MKFQNFVIFSFQVTINIYHHDIPADTRRRFNVYKTSIRRRRRVCLLGYKLCVPELLLIFNFFIVCIIF